MSTQISIGTKLVQAVQKEAAMRRPLPLQATVEEGGVKASVALTDHDRLSHLAGEVKVAVTPDARPARNPQSKAEAFAGRATYLTEALGFVETDAGGTAVLRSQPAAMRGKGTEYFEARVGESELSLKRYQSRAGRGGRDAVPFPLTDETLARLTDDAASSLSAGRAPGNRKK